MSFNSRFPFPREYQEEFGNEFESFFTEEAGQRREKQRGENPWSSERGRSSFRSGREEGLFSSREEYPPRRRPSPARQRAESPYQAFPQRGQSGPTIYHSEDLDLPEEFRRQRSPPPASTRGERFARSSRRAQSPPRRAYSEEPRQGYYTSPPSAYSSHSRQEYPSSQYSGSSARPQSRSSSERTQGSPAPSAYSSHSRQEYPAPPQHQQPRRAPSSRSYSPPPVIRDENPLGLYTYSDEEPDTIPVTPEPWNNNSTSVSRDQLIAFLRRQGYAPPAAKKEADTAFEAHAPQRAAGLPRPGPSRAEQQARGGQGRGNPYQHFGYGSHAQYEEEEEDSEDVGYEYAYEYD